MANFTVIELLQRHVNAMLNSLQASKLTMYSTFEFWLGI